MLENKQRNYKYDALRGICMFLIVLQHFLFKGGYHFTDKTGFLIYVGIDMFTMQTFFFLSGMFSKNPDKNRDKLFSSLLWPVIIAGLVYWPLIIEQKGLEFAVMRFKAGVLPYATWFLVVLFVYRYFQKYYAKNAQLPLIALTLYFVSGIFDPLSGKGFAVSRMCTFFISFVMGYKMTMEQVERYRLRSVWKIALLGIALVLVTVGTVYYLPDNVAVAIRLKASFHATGMTILEGVLVRAGLLLVSTGWMLFFFSILPDKKGLWAHIGMNTMPIYLFHLVLVGVFKLYKGFTFGYFDFKGYGTLYLICLFAISMAVTILLSTKPAAKVYHIVFDGTYSLVSRAFHRAFRSLKPVQRKIEKT